MRPTFKTAPRLSRGDLVGVVAPGFAVRPARLRVGLAALRRMGFTPRPGRHVLARDGYLAGTDEQRASDLNEMIRDREVRAIWFARGGYGTARLLDRVDWRTLRRNPKPLIGYSDLTALFQAVLRRTGQECLYGPVVTELGSPAAYHALSLRRALRGEPTSLALRRRQVFAPGHAEGPLAGGNLSVLVHLLGTRHLPDLRGSILLIEDTGEEVYRLDRMLRQLLQAGVLAGVAGVLLGGLDPPAARRRFPADRPLETLLAETFLPLGVPVVRDLPAGHVPKKWTLPLGSRVRMDTSDLRVHFRSGGGVPGRNR